MFVCFVLLPVNVRIGDHIWVFGVYKTPKALYVY